jgi:hypothetical protein
MPFFRLNGQVIEAPTPDAARARFAQRAALQQQYQSEAPSAVEGMSGPQRFVAGIGQGATHAGRQVGNLLGVVSDEALQDAASLDKGLLGTGAGQAGAFLGEVAATAPVGGLVGAGGRTLASQLGAKTLGKKLATVAAGGLGQGAAEGALMAGPGDRGAGAAIGGAAGAVLPYVGGTLVQSVTRGIRPSAPARELMRKNVDLTPGQMNPGSMLGQLEEAATNVWGVGPLIQSARERALQGWQRAARRAVLPPGVNPSQANGSIDSVYAEYGPAYDAAKKFPVYPRTMPLTGPGVPLASFSQRPGLFTLAARDPDVIADATKRKAVDAWLQNKLTQLPGAGRQLVTSDDLLKLRSDIRDQIRKASLGPAADTSQADLLRNAERAVTDVLDSQLPPGVLQGLRATDAQYAQYKVLEDATRRAGDQLMGVTPSQLSAAVRAATPHGAYARGAGGDLRKLASTGKQAFDTRTPPTGVRLATLAIPATVLATNPVAGALLAGTVGFAAATRSGRRMLSGQTAPQDKARRLIAALRRKAGPGNRADAKTVGIAASTAAGRAAEEQE